MCVQPVSGCFRSSHTQWPASAVPATAMLRTVGEAVCSVPCASSEGSLSLPSPGRPPPRSSVPPPDLRSPGSPYPLALQAADGGISVILFFLVASLALDIALEFFGHLGTPLGLQGAPLCLLSSPLGLLGAPLSSGRAPLIEGKHRIKEIHVVVCRDLREFPRSLSRKLLLSG